MIISADLLPRLQRVKLFLCDVDGVLTDGTVFMGAGGSELKGFNVRDGLGIRMWQNEGFKVGWISARPSPATVERAKDLKVDFVHQSSGPKVEGVAVLLRQNDLDWADISYLGDDVIDLGVLRRAGFAATPADAHPDAKAAAHYVCSAAGGRGAVRELVELILRAQGRWDAILSGYAA